MCPAGREHSSDKGLSIHIHQGHHMAQSWLSPCRVPKRQTGHSRCLGDWRWPRGMRSCGPWTQANPGMDPCQPPDHSSPGQATFVLSCTNGMATTPLTQRQPALLISVSMSAGAAGPVDTRAGAGAGAGSPGTPGSLPLQGPCTWCSLCHEHASSSPLRVYRLVPLACLCPSAIPLPPPASALVPCAQWVPRLDSCCSFILKAPLLMVDIYSRCKHHLFQGAILTSFLFPTGPLGRHE